MDRRSQNYSWRTGQRAKSSSHLEHRTRGEIGNFNVRFPPKAGIAASRIRFDLGPRFVGTFVGIPRVAEIFQSYFPCSGERIPCYRQRYSLLFHSSISSISSSWPHKHCAKRIF